MENNFNLKVKQVLNLYNYRYKYYRKGIIKDIKEDLEDGKNTDKFILKKKKKKTKVYCNVEGAKIIAYWTNTDFSDYEETLIHLNANKRLTEDKPELNTTINLRHDDTKYFKDEFLNGYISDECLVMALNGKTIKDIDINKCSARDIKTYNMLIKKYNDVAKAGHLEQDYRLSEVFKTLIEKDPDVCKRNMYIHDYNQVDIDEHMMRIKDYEGFIEMKKAITRYRKKADKNLEKKSNQRFLDELYETVYSDYDE